MPYFGQEKVLIKTAVARFKLKTAEENAALKAFLKAHPDLDCQLLLHHLASMKSIPGRFSECWQFSLLSADSVLVAEVLARPHVGTLHDKHGANVAHYLAQTRNFTELASMLNQYPAWAASTNKSGKCLLGYLLDVKDYTDAEFEQLIAVFRSSPALLAELAVDSIAEFKSAVSRNYEKLLRAFPSLAPYIAEAKFDDSEDEFLHDHVRLINTAKELSIRIHQKKVMERSADWKDSFYKLQKYTNQNINGAKAALDLVAHNVVSDLKRTILKGEEGWNKQFDELDRFAKANIPYAALAYDQCAHHDIDRLARLLKNGAPKIQAEALERLEHKYRKHHTVAAQLVSTYYLGYFDQLKKKALENNKDKSARDMLISTVNENSFRSGEAALRLGEYYLAKRDYKNGVKYIEIAVGRQITDAFAVLAGCYQHGYEKKKDAIKALENYFKGLPTDVACAGLRDLMSHADSKVRCEAALLYGLHINDVKYFKQAFSHDSAHYHHVVKNKLQSIDAEPLSELTLLLHAVLETPSGEARYTQALFNHLISHWKLLAESDNKEASASHYADAVKRVLPDRLYVKFALQLDDYYESIPTAYREAVLIEAVKWANKSERHEVEQHLARYEAEKQAVKNPEPLIKLDAEDFVVAPVAYTEVSPPLYSEPMVAEQVPVTSSAQRVSQQGMFAQPVMLSSRDKQLEDDLAALAALPKVADLPVVGSTGEQKDDVKRERVALFN